VFADERPESSYRELAQRRIYSEHTYDHKIKMYL